MSLPKRREATCIETSIAKRNVSVLTQYEPVFLKKTNSVRSVCSSLNVEKSASQRGNEPRTKVRACPGRSYVYSISLQFSNTSKFNMECSNRGSEIRITDFTYVKMARTSELT